MSNKENDVISEAIEEGYISPDSPYLPPQSTEGEKGRVCYLCASKDARSFLNAIKLCTSCQIKLALELLHFKCAKCGNDWRGRYGIPDRCPDCGCKKWWEEKRGYRKGEENG